MNQEILKKVIRKAVKNGWKVKGIVINKDGLTEKSWKSIFKFVFREHPCFYLFHDFAKAYWGEDEWYFSGWRGKLKEMILEEDKIKYLEKFL